MRKSVFITFSVIDKWFASKNRPVNVSQFFLLVCVEFENLMLTFAGIF
jgi:hypothetical protein